MIICLLFSLVFTVTQYYKCEGMEKHFGNVESDQNEGKIYIKDKTIKFITKYQLLTTGRLYFDVIEANVKLFCISILQTSFDAFVYISH